MRSRVISGIIAIIYIVIAFFVDGAASAFRVLLFLILPLACIWFSDEMGSYTGIGFGRGAITSTTPGCMVAFGGWLLLLLPLIAAAIMFLMGKSLI